MQKGIIELSLTFIIAILLGLSIMGIGYVVFGAY